MVVFGTRPEAIKMAPVLQALQSDRGTFEPICCVTAQHRHLLDQMLELFGIVPDIDLDLMRAGQDVIDVHTAVLDAMRPILIRAKPDVVLVHGDTTTAMAAALAAFYAHIPVGHVEAGLRSGDLRSPFPEELNRRVIDMVASYRFAPTGDSRAQLVAEGCDPASIIVTGNTVVDAIGLVIGRMDADPALRMASAGRLDRALGFDWRARRFVIVTCHRRETFARGLEEVCGALAEISAAFPDTEFVYPVHPNPAVNGPVRAMLGAYGNIRLVDSLPYDAFVLALSHCHFVLTDSGGLQEEAPALGKPVLVMRDVTERGEAVVAGGHGSWARAAPASWPGFPASWPIHRTMPPWPRRPIPMATVPPRNGSPPF